MRVKVIAGIILPMILMLGLFTAIEYTHHREVLLDNLTTLASYNGRLIEETLQHAMLVSNFNEVQRILDSAGHNPDFKVVYLLDATGKVIFAPNGNGVGTHLNNLNPTCQTCHKLPVGSRPSGVVVTEEDGQRVFRSMQPIQNGPTCTQCHDPKQKVIGALLTDISVAPFEAAFLEDLRQNLLWGGSMIFLSGLIAYLVLSRLVVRRVRRVADALVNFDSSAPGSPLGTGSMDEIGQLEVDFDEMAQRIQAEETKVQALSANLTQKSAQQQDLLKRLITAQEEERKRVARELHDELGQSLSGLALHTQVVSRVIETDPAQAQQELSLIRKLIGKTTDQMYELIMALRPSILDDLGLVAALQAHAERVLDGTQFTLDASELTQRLPAAIETSLYRIFQEALNNVVRHSKASQVWVKLARRDDAFLGEIRDNGQGFTVDENHWKPGNPRGLGLMGMQERLAECGGKLEIRTQPGQGTHIFIHIPLEEACHE